MATCRPLMTARCTEVHLFVEKVTICLSYRAGSGKVNTLSCNLFSIIFLPYKNLFCERGSKQARLAFYFKVKNSYEGGGISHIA